MGHLFFRKSKFNPGAETTDITGLKSGSSRQDVHLPHQIPKPSDTRHTQMSGMPLFGGTKYGEEATHELRQWGGFSEQGKLFNARDDPVRVHNDRFNRLSTDEIIRLGPTRTGSTSRGGATAKFEKVSIGKFEGDIRELSSTMPLRFRLSSKLCHHR